MFVCQGRVSPRRRLTFFASLYGPGTWLGVSVADLIFKLAEDYFKEQALMTVEQLAKIVDEHAAREKQRVAKGFGQG